MARKQPSTVEKNYIKILIKMAIGSLQLQVKQSMLYKVQSRNTFRSTVTQKTFKIYNKLNCKSRYLIYLMEFVVCSKQYSGKSETAFNLRLNNHRKDLNKRNLLEADQRCWLPGHKFNKHAKFTLIKWYLRKQGTTKT